MSLLADGKTTELAGLFANQSEVVEPLQRMLKSLGKVSSIEKTATARFSQHKRISIQAKDLPPSYNYQGDWFSAHSGALGAVQFHIARSPKSACRLLALHLDTAL